MKKTYREYLGRPLNILTEATHEAYQTNAFGGLPHTFYMLQQEGTKEWHKEFRSVPNNHHFIKTPPNGVTIDLVLCHSRFGQFNRLSQIARKLHVPLIQIEHEGPSPRWNEENLSKAKSIRGSVNLFITEWSKKEWGFEDGHVIYHGINTDDYVPGTKKTKVLTVLNYLTDRSDVISLSDYNRLTKDMDSELVGMSNYGESKPAKNEQELINKYKEANIYLNVSSTQSPVPTALMEAMSAGCCVVSLPICGIPELVQHSRTGFLCSSIKDMRDCLEKLYANPELCEEIGANARKHIVENYGLKKFQDNWNQVLEQTYRNG